jgi:3-hydroxyacyl-CoA dehydrogenase/enoyl-CoA hydratase/3-hydroxybutyryl-CoA epimerase
MTEQDTGAESDRRSQIHLFMASDRDASAKRTGPAAGETDARAGGYEDEPAPDGARDASDPGVYLEEPAPGVAAIVFRSPTKKVNVLTSALLDRLRGLIREIRTTAHFRAVLVKSGIPGTFIAGADVNEIAKVSDVELGRQAARLGQSIFQELADLPIPSVAAIGGICLGGGTELALACSYRLASDSPKVRIGLPEVRLGILPGWGGTQRLPRLIGLPSALELVLTGRNLDGRRARRRGLVDVVIPDVIFERESIRFAERVASGVPPAPGVPPFENALKAQARRARLSVMDRFLESRIGRGLLFKMTERRTVASTKGHYRAPLVALDAMRRGWDRPLTEALEVEATALGERMIDEEKRALVHVFFLAECNRRDPGVATDVLPREIHRAGLLGAGLMGGGIAQLLSRPRGGRSADGAHTPHAGLQRVRPGGRDLRSRRGKDGDQAGRASRGGSRLSR